ncbi:uncharacterized protein LOC120843617 [Ixodes scapularis]|uniref:uncharacterized protein LOC120843617 n=1 Tax=Ixodes scapularis TaxID=6945 RepID=UPI001A9EDF66|nr:uncharacterized protein LOC120843617 [Ixodes scapularis]
MHPGRSGVVNADWLNRNRLLVCRRLQGLQDLLVTACISLPCDSLSGLGGECPGKSKVHMRVVPAGDLCPGQCRQFRDGPPRVELCWWRRVCNADVGVTSPMTDSAEGAGTMTVGGVSGRRNLALMAVVPLEWQWGAHHVQEPWSPAERHQADLRHQVWKSLSSPRERDPPIAPWQHTTAGALYRPCTTEVIC